MKTPLNKHALAWLKERANADQWGKIRRMKGDAEKVMSYLAENYPGVHAELSQLFPAPSSLEIGLGGFRDPSTAEIVAGKPLWRSLDQISRDELETKVRQLRDGQQLMDLSEFELVGPDIDLAKAGLQ